MALRTKETRAQGLPVLPTKRQETDPTRQSRNRKSALVDTRKRYSKIKKDVFSVVSTFLSNIDKTIIQNNDTNLKNNRLYEYMVDYDQISNISSIIYDILTRYLETRPDFISSGAFWMNNYVDVSYKDGANASLQSAKNVSTEENVGEELSNSVRIATIDQIVMDPQYQRRVGLINGRVFESMLGLTDSTKADLTDVLTRGMTLGQGIGEITRNIINRVEVSQNRAEKIARTEINNAYRSATTDETQAINNRLFDSSDYEMRFLWFSALSPTTRLSHARRHGRTYTKAEVDSFYSRDGNAINCLCSITPVLVNKKTGEVVQEALVREMRKERFVWVDEDEAA